MIAMLSKFLLSKILPFRSLILGGIAVAALGVGFLYVQHLRSEVKAMTVQRDKAVETARANAHAVTVLEERQAMTVAALEREREALRRRVERMTAIRTEIENAPESDDGPVAPVLSRALDGLRGKQAGDEGEGREAEGAGEPVVLRPGAGSPGR